MGGRDHSCEGCGRGGFNDPDGVCDCWSPSYDSVVEALRHAVVRMGACGWAIESEQKLLTRAQTETLAERVERLEDELVDAEAAVEQKRNEDGP